MVKVSEGLSHACMQAVPVTGGAVLGGPVARAVFAHSERWGSLLAAGGTAPLHVHMWSLLHEQCIQQVPRAELACVDAGRGKDAG